MAEEMWPVKGSPQHMAVALINHATCSLSQLAVSMRVSLDLIEAG